MATAFLKTVLMTWICFFGFILSPFAFPALLITVFVLWASPYILAVIVEDRRAKKAADLAEAAAARPPAPPPTVGALTAPR
jgi:hypothetical protein